MSRVIIQVGPDRDDALCFRLERGPIPPTDPKPRKLVCSAAQLPTGKPPPPPNGWVREYGRRLWQELSQHPDVQRALSNAAGAPAGQTQSIMFNLLDQRAELYNWEMLCDEGDHFLALAQAPIGRIAEQGIDLAGSVPTFTGQLRITAVLSALGVPAEQEWSGLYAAVQAARATGIRVSVTVLVGEEDLLDKISDVAAQDRDLHAVAVPDRGTDVLRAITDSRPHVLHFFCHGAADQGQPRLLLATGQDVERQAVGPATPSVRLHIEQMRTLLAPLGVWLVVLNCCQGGMAAQEVHSLAHSLAAAGVPAALGMRETVQALAAYEFSRVFYRELLTELGTRLTRPAAGVVDCDIDWPHILNAPRAALVESYSDDATTFGEWTLPVLYTRLDPFQVRLAAQVWDAEAEEAAPQPVPGPPGLTSDGVTMAIVAALLNRLPADTPPDAVAELRRLAGAPPPDGPGDTPAGAG
ncbi:CHAT domain-containing protein [Krasilnikovia sp. MM14-A1004]|uniref:CHAT domain-containing protein n=1 Tax=Krasilnikovia sp. MM14-A1004 TaxID=3373541 RepID=UPI00399C77F7